VAEKLAIQKPKKVTREKASSSRQRLPYIACEVHFTEKLTFVEEIPPVVGIYYCSRCTSLHK